ncbi:MAG TPA: VWA domain-containing protein [Candidatus Limnocylindrales bacterium]|nr:VWA domain-containing protein [Candidatus Limnocylindrales bacterium]
MNRFRLPACAAIFLGVSALCAAPLTAQKKEKLPRPVQMDAGVHTKRNPRTGELVFRRGAANARGEKMPAALAAIRVRVNLVEVGCNVFAADGTAVRGLTQRGFRIFDDGVEQTIAHFDASSQGASIALVLDASPSVLPDSAAMKAAAQQLIANLSPADEVAVVDFSEHTYLLLPFSRDRKLLEKAVSGVDVRKLFWDTGGSNIYRSVYLAANELFPGRTGRKAIILLTDGQDSGLGLNLDGEGVRPQPGNPRNRVTFEDVVKAVASQNIEIYAISTQNRPRVMTPAWLAAHQGDSLITPAALSLGIPAYTDFLAELVRRAGGQLYFLNEVGTIADAYRRIVQNLSAQYTLGFYPPESQKPGWHSLRVEVAGHGAVRVVHRATYYAPAESR